MSSSSPLTFVELSSRGAIVAGDSAAVIDSDTLLRASQDIIRNIATNIKPGVEEYMKYVNTMIATEPITLVIAVEGNELNTPNVRSYANTVMGQKFQLEGLETCEQQRSKGIGKRVMDELKAMAIRNGSTHIVCQADTTNYGATRFLLKEGMYIQCFSFTGPATPRLPSNSPPPLASPSPSPSPIPSPVSPRAAFDVRHVTDGVSSEVTPEGELLLRAAEPVLRQLRPNLAPGTEAFIHDIKRIFKDGGRMIVAIKRRDDGEDPTTPLVALGVGIFRYYVDFTSGRLRNWVDDLVTDANQRSAGVGHGMMEELRAVTRACGVETVQLDSAVYRRDAHRFYFREGFIIDLYSYAHQLKQ